MNTKHRDLTPAGVTGDTPTAALLCGMKRKDGGSTGHASQELLPYRAMMFGWAGCIDAPDAILLGGCCAVDTGRFEHGLGYEGTTPRTGLRDRMAD